MRIICCSLEITAEVGSDVQVVSWRVAAVVAVLETVSYNKANMFLTVLVFPRAQLGLLTEGPEDVDTCIFTFCLTGCAEECVCCGLLGPEDTAWTRTGFGSTVFPSVVAAAPWTADPEVSLPTSGSTSSEICPGSERREAGGGGVGGRRPQSVPLHLAQGQLPVSSVHPGLGTGAEAAAV